MFEFNEEQKKTISLFIAGRYHLAGIPYKKSKELGVETMECIEIIINSKDENGNQDLIPEYLPNTDPGTII